MSLKYIKYQSALPLINRVKDTLHSFDAAGLIDDGQFFDWIKVEMQELGYGYYEEVETILDVQGYKAVVPRDFVSLYSLMRCTFKGSEIMDTKKVVTPITVNYLETCETNILKAPCKGFEYFGKYIRMQEHVELAFPRYREYETKGFLRWTNRVAKQSACATDCVNVNVTSNDEFTLDSNFFYFNFDKDSVHLRYYRLAVDEDGLPMIPDIASVKQAIEKYIIYRLFQQWYYNNDVDVQQRMQFAEQEYRKYHSDAERDAKMPSQADLIEYALHKQKKNDLFHIPNAAMRKY